MAPKGPKRGSTTGAAAATDDPTGPAANRQARSPHTHDTDSQTHEPAVAETRPGGVVCRTAQVVARQNRENLAFARLFLDSKGS